MTSGEGPGCDFNIDFAGYLAILEQWTDQLLTAFTPFTLPARTSRPSLREGEVDVVEMCRDQCPQGPQGGRQPEVNSGQFLSGGVVFRRTEGSGSNRDRFFGGTCGDISPHSVLDNQRSIHIDPNNFDSIA